jgi:gamma-glutamyltranspeptidase/glutathione hydrolase
MVSTSSPLAVQAGLWALAEGGTAVDAAIASDAVLGVVQPFWTGIGGDLFCLVDDGDQVAGFNGSGAAPAGLTLAVCQAERAAHPVAEELQGWLTGLPDGSPLAVTVPGVVDGWVQLSERFGRLDLRRTLEPACRLAEHGFPLGPLAGRAWRGDAGRLRPGSPFGRGVEPGQRITNPAQAASLRAIAEGGRDAHYGGPWGRAATEAVQAEGGVLAVDDLTAHRGEWVEPITGCYRGVEVVELPPNGQGAAVLVALARREGEPAGSPDDPDRVAATMVAVRDAMQLTERHAADPRLVEVPAFWEASGGRDTVYTAVMAGGMSVSLISSVFWVFGSGITAGGVVLQNRGCGFSLEADHPNAAAPGKRPFHTIIPAMLRRDDRAWVAMGVVGGPMQPQGQVQVISHLVDHGFDAQRALDAPRARWLGRDLIAVEEGFSPDVGSALRAAGFRVTERPLPPREAGAGQVIGPLGVGWLVGGPDRRRDGAAFGH